MLLSFAVKRSRVFPSLDTIARMAFVSKRTILTTMFVTYLCLAYAGKLVARLGPMGIDATTRIVGFFVSAMGVGLIFDGVFEALQAHGVTTLH